MEIAKTLNDQLLEQYDKQKGLYQSFASEIEHQIKSILQASGIECNAIVSRFKTRESIAEKIIRKQGKYTNLSDITDIAGVRIITYYSEDVDRVSDIIECEFNIDRENSIDKRESMEPDRFGYCSVHYVVEMDTKRLALREYGMYKGIKCEIQIRSVLQHAWAEIEHDIGYKSEVTVPKEVRRNFSRLAGLLEIADKEFNEIRTTLQNYKNTVVDQLETDDFFNHEIDAVLLSILIDSNKNIIRLNKHIENITNCFIEDVLEDGAYQSTINELKSLGIMTLGDVNNLILNYTDIAILIATEKLSHYKEKMKKYFLMVQLLFSICVMHFC